MALAFIGFVSFYMEIHLFADFNSLKKWLDFRETNLDATDVKIIRCVLLIANLVISIFFFPVFLLFCVQVKNLCLNKTTYERIRGDNSSVKEQLKGKNKGGIVKNCKAMCGATRESFISS